MSGKSAMALLVVAMAHAPLSAQQASTSRAENQLPYFIPGPLDYAKDELEAVRKAAVARNVAVLGDQVQAAADRTAYVRERQAIAAEDFDRRRWLAMHERRAHDRQMPYSDVVFVVANVVVVLGLVLTVWQFSRDHGDWRRLFRHNMRVLGAMLRKGKAQVAELPTSGSETKISLRSDGLEIGTRVTGLAILIISLGFYYLMLVHVYRIEIAGSPELHASAASSAPSGK